MLMSGRVIPTILGQVVGDWPSAGAQLWGVSPKAAEELESRRACGGLW